MLEEEIESWKGFPWALRKEDLEQWEAMINEIREQFGEAVEASGKDFTTDPFFMALLLAQQKTIKHLQTELKDLGVEIADSKAATAMTLDM
jgi:hypothetical protein